MTNKKKQNIAQQLQPQEQVLKAEVIAQKN